MILSKSLVILLAGSGIAAGVAMPPSAAPRTASEALRGFGRSVAIAGEFAFVIGKFCTVWFSGKETGRRAIAGG